MKHLQNETPAKVIPSEDTAADVIPADEIPEAKEKPKKQEINYNQLWN
ncbi:MAG: hypothetical protein HAW62_01410 [Endozoicomonadaceae bacterium]|nr:hypothetical protein [Endozoicomonadaceae bacterium]